MAKPKVKVKVKKGKGKSTPAKVKTKMKQKMYVGGEAERLYQELNAERAKTDSLQRRIDSLECKIKIKIEQQ